MVECIGSGRRWDLGMSWKWILRFVHRPNTCEELPFKDPGSSVTCWIETGVFYLPHSFRLSSKWGLCFLLYPEFFPMIPWGYKIPITNSPTHKRHGNLPCCGPLRIQPKSWVWVIYSSRNVLKHHHCANHCFTQWENISEQNRQRNSLYDGPYNLVKERDGEITKCQEVINPMRRNEV